MNDIPLLQRPFHRYRVWRLRRRLNLIRPTRVGASPEPGSSQPLPRESKPTEAVDALKLGLTVAALVATGFIIGLRGPQESPDDPAPTAPVPLHPAPANPPHHAL